MKTVDYYFDFMSPYAYLACTQIPRLSESWKGRADFRGHCFDMWAARIAAGNTGPSNRQIPAKGAVLMADVARWAKRYGVPVAPPKSFDTARLNRGFLVAGSRGAEIPYMTEVFARLWGAGGDPAEDSLLVEAAEAAGLNGAEMLREADAPETIAAYEDENRQAQAKGVFGAPMFIVDDQVFWGNDRIAWVEDYLSDHVPAAR